MILRWAMDVTTRRDAEPSTDTVADSPLIGAWHHAVAWVIAARRVPALARPLVHATLRIDPADASPEDLSGWVRRFLFAPPWLRIASLLAEEPRLEECASAVPIAFLARSVAEQTGWAEMEAVFWGALLRPNLTAPVRPNGLEDPWSECRSIAAALIPATSSPFDRSNRLERLEILRRLQLQHAELDWRALETEANQLSDRPSLSLTASLRDELIDAARANARTVEGEFYRSLYHIAATETEDPYSHAAKVLAGLLGPRFAFWLRSPVGDAGVGVLQDENRTESSLESDDRARLPRSVFEKGLPTDLRCSFPLVASDGAAIGRVYLADDSPDDVSDWTARLSEAYRAWFARRKQVADRVDEADAARDWTRWIRRRMQSAVKEFSAGAAHEINNPLGTIQGKTHRLLTGETDSERRADLHKIQQQVARIHAMIRDLHFVGRGGLQTDASASVAAVVQHALEHLGNSPRGVDLHVGPVHDSLTVPGDRRDVGRAVQEVLRNAITAAAPRGRVALSVEATEDAWCLMRITDTGSGFSAADLLHAFDPFYSGSSAGRGLGMGLTVAQSVVEACGGKISLRSALPATVEILLPLVAPESAL